MMSAQELLFVIAQAVYDLQTATQLLIVVVALNSVLSLASIGLIVRYRRRSDSVRVRVRDGKGWR